MSEHGTGTMVVHAGLTSVALAARRRARLGELVRAVERKVAEGGVTADDAWRYRMARLAQCLLDSPGRLPYVPAVADEILATRDALEVRRIIGPEMPGPAVA
jgi:hypothetical protein